MPHSSFESLDRSSLHGLRRRSGACRSLAALGNGLKLQRSLAAKATPTVIPGAAPPRPRLGRGRRIYIYNHKYIIIYIYIYTHTHTFHVFPYYCMFFVEVYPHTYRFYTHVVIYFFCSNNPDSEWLHTGNPLKGTQVYRMKTLAECLDDTHFRFPPQCCNSVVVEADSKFECSTSSPHCLPRCSVDIAQLYPEQTYKMRVVSSEMVAFTMPDQLQAMTAFVMPFIFPRLTIPKLLVPTDQTLSFLLRTSFGLWIVN